MYLGSWVWRKSLKGLMCGPFSSMRTRSPACARRSAGAAAPNPVPITNTSVWMTPMPASSGPVPVRRQRPRQEPRGVGVGDGFKAAKLVGAFEVDQCAAALGVVDAAVVAGLHHENRAAVEPLGGGIRRETLLHHRQPLRLVEVIERRAGPGGGALAQVGYEEPAIGREAQVRVVESAQQIGIARIGFRDDREEE